MMRCCCTHHGAHRIPMKLSWPHAHAIPECVVHLLFNGISSRPHEKSFFVCLILFSDAIYYLSVANSAVIGYILTAHVSARCTCTAERKMWTEKICRRTACTLWRFDWVLCSTHLMGSREVSHINLFIEFQSKITILGRASNPVNERMSWWI